MGFAPKSNGEVAPLQFSWPERVKAINVAVNAVKHCAETFWENLVKEAKISDEFRQFIAQKVIPQLPKNNPLK
jgi:hypothetical protein